MQSPSTLPAYEALAHDIKRLGVDAVFGLMSDDTALFVTTLDSMGVRFHGARHENNAVAMAEGYAAATGRLGIAIIGRGPATANAMNGSLYAMRSGSRVLIVFGAPSTTTASPNGLGPDTKALDQAKVLEAVGIRTFVAEDAHAARRMLARAVAATERGAAALLLPMNVQFAQVADVDAEAPVHAAALRDAYGRCPPGRDRRRRRPAAAEPPAAHRRRPRRASCRRACRHRAARRLHRCRAGDEP